MENTRNILKKEFIKTDDNEKIIEQQSKLTFNGIHKCYTNYGSYLFKQKKLLMDELVYVGFGVIEVSKLWMYETYYDKLQPYSREKNIQLHYMDTDSTV